MTYSTSVDTSDDPLEFDLIYEGLLNLNEDFLDQLLETDLDHE